MPGKIPIRVIPVKNNDMNPNLAPLPVKAYIIICLFCCFCHPGHREDFRVPAPPVSIGNLPDQPLEGLNPYPSIGAIPLPSGYRRIPAQQGSFAAWLRTVPLKKDRKVRLYDGSPKPNQEAQFAVLDVSVGNSDLQQCADAVMRLRAEFLYSRRDFKAIEFPTEQGIRLNFAEWAAGKRWRLSRGSLVAYQTRAAAPGGVGLGSDSVLGNRKCFWEYLETVFSFCGTRTLEKQLDPLTSDGAMHIGDVFIRGGSPGHAMLVVDMGADTMGRKIYMLAQGYMPAQDIHIVRDYGSPGLSPWYPVGYDRPVNTPEWVFYPGQLRTWPGAK